MIHLLQILLDNKSPLKGEKEDVWGEYIASKHFKVKKIDLELQCLFTENIFLQLFEDHQ